MIEMAGVGCGESVLPGRIGSRIRMKAKALAFGLCTLAFHGAIGTPATAHSIRQLMDLTGAGNMGVQMIQRMLPALKRGLPDAPDAFWDKFMTSVRPEELVDLVIPIYQRNLTEEDIQAALKFYASPPGQRLISKLPVIAQQSMEAGQMWGQALAQRAIAELKENPPQPK